MWDRYAVRGQRFLGNMSVKHESGALTLGIPMPEKQWGRWQKKRTLPTIRMIPNVSSVAQIVYLCDQILQRGEAEES